MSLINCLLSVLLLVSISSVFARQQHELCVDSSPPITLASDLSFCNVYKNGTHACCDSGIDSSRQTLYNSWNIPPASECAYYMRRIACGYCDAWSSHLYDGTPTPDVPWLCSNFCVQVYNSCSDIMMDNNPFDSSRRTIALNSLYPNATSFCASFGHDPAQLQYCYDGTPYTLPPAPVINGNIHICLETLLSNSARYITLAVIPNDPRIFLGRQACQIDVIADRNNFVNPTPYLRLLSKCIVDTNSERGLLGIAFHPNFTLNGRFFVHYSCPKAYNACNLSPLSYDHMSVVAEYRPSDGNSSAMTADPNEVRRIYTYPQPYSNHNGGQLLFGPDGYLYITFGDGGSGNDPQQNAQNLNNPLGKILRIDVNSQSNGKNYNIPPDNPFVSGGGLPEIYAYGLRNPWRCHFDSARPEYFLCGDVGQDMIEEVDFIVPGGNYGWRKYEGTRLNFPNDPPISNPIFPIMEYNHNGGAASVTGGITYRGTLDPCYDGAYIFADYSTSRLFVGREILPGSRSYTFYGLTPLCANDSPSACSTNLGNIFSFGEDNDKNLYILSSSGIYRLAARSRCGLNATCVDAELIPPSGSQPTLTTSPSSTPTPTQTPSISSPTPTPSPSVSPPSISPSFVSPPTGTSPVRSPPTTRSVSTGFTTNGSWLFLFILLVVLITQ